MAEFIEILSTKALADIKEANSEVLKLVSGIDKAGEAMKNIKTPSGSDTAVKNLQKSVEISYEKMRLAEIKLQQAREKAFDDYQKTIDKKAQAEQKAAEKAIRESERIIKQKEKEFAKFERDFNKYEADLAKQAIAEQKAKKAKVQAILDESKAIQSLQRQKEKSIADEAKEQAKLKASENLYNKVQQKLNALSNEYKALATKKELGLTLTDKEEKTYQRLRASIDKYDKVLKGVDASMGKYQRNVGNYASAFNPLSNSINQLTREMPAFANSVQTGFMAISNNLPVFFDAIQQIIEQNKELRAQGQPTQSVLSQLGASFFTLGTALSVGVTLLTVYGKDLVELAFGLTEAEKAQEAYKETLSEVNNLQETQVVEIEALSKAVLDTTKSEKERLVAYDALKETMPELERMTMNQAISTGYLTKITEKYITAIISRAKAEKLASEIADLEIKNDKQRSASLEDQVKWTDRLMSFIKYRDVSGKTNAATRVAEETFERQKQIDALKELYSQNLITAESLEGELLGLQKTTKATKEKTEAKRKDIEALTLAESKTKSLIDALEEEKKAIELLQQANSRNNSEWEMYQKGIDEVQFKIDATKNGYKDLRDSAMSATKVFEQQTDALNNTKKSMQELNPAIKSFLLQFQTSFFSEAGLPTLFKVLNNEITGFGKNFAVTFTTMAEIAQEAFSFISEASNKNFQNEYDNLAKQKEISLLFAGESASARAEIERQYDQRQREIKRRQAQAEKRQALFNIAIDTAQGVVSALASTPPNVPLSIAIGVIGAIQAGVVAGQQIPQFWRGTENAPEGWAYTQERGAEIITDKNNKIKYLGDGNGAQLTYLNKGDKVKTASMTKDLLSFDQSLNNILLSNNIDGAPRIEVNNSAMSDAQVDRIVRTIEGKTEYMPIIDKDGFNDYVRKGNTVYQNKNRKVNFKGTQVG